MDHLCRACNYRFYATGVLSNEQLCILSENCTQIKFNKGQTIFKQDTRSINVCFLKKGLAKLHMKGICKRDQLIKIVNSPIFLGISSALGDEIYHFSATAIADSEVCFIDLDIFKNLILSNQQFAYEIIVDMCKNELINYRNCMYRTQKNSRGLVADTLLEFSDIIFKNEEFRLPLSRNEFAEFINSSRESVCRILSEFHNDNIINLKGKNIKILSKDRLIKISEKG